ncbi:SDR family oxidoreductase [Deinococcus planocerae]|uniref:SDR family oxidoreductase n=1 Tax=Deinococcus planocerae TaxID=1737569 RepID=UPI000C7F31D8|nr:SDR family oxidoreductase [Deinococcus planocerae]
MSEDQQKTLPAQQQDEQPGIEAEMDPPPVYIKLDYKAAGKLQGKAAIITGGDSGIGRAVAVHFAREGADVAIVYLDETEDAQKTKRLVEEAGQKCLTIAGDVGDPQFCQQAVRQAVDTFGRLDILVNNAAEQHPKEDVSEITPEQLEKTFRTNIFGYFYMAQAALEHLKEGATIINTSSVTNYKGSPSLVDYASTKGAITSFTRSLSMQLVEKGIRVNGVAPGPIWTPLIPSTFPPEKVETFGADVPMARPGQPAEVATCFVFLASDDSSYISGQMLHPNGGEVVNG